MNISILEKKNIREMVFPITIQQYHRLSYEGIIGEKTELIEGVITKKMTKSPEHSFIVMKLYETLREIFNQTDFLIRKEEPLTIGTSEPEPDLSVVKGSMNDFRTSHPNFAILVIEVSSSSLEFDREKRVIYAGAGIPEYWVVNLGKKEIEIFSNPKDNDYQLRKILITTDSIFLNQKAIKIQNIFESP